MGAAQSDAVMWRQVSRIQRGMFVSAWDRPPASTKVMLLAPLCTGGQWLISSCLEATA